jgi:Na+/proline symporter
MSLLSISVIDILIFVVFFALNIIVGFRYRGKRQSFREYAIGDKKFSTATLTATLVATFMSGSVFFVGLENTYQKGLYYALAIIIGATARMLITGRIVGPRMGKLRDHVSLPDALGKLYGKYVQLIAGISCVIHSVGYIAVQFKIIAKILAIVFNYESPIIVIIAAAIVTLYSLSGGVKAVTFTDVLQFFTFGTLLPILALTIWNNLQDHDQVVHMLKTNPLFSLKEVIGWTPEFLYTLALMAYFAIPELAPELFQRIAMAKDTTQVKHSMTWAAVICLGLKLCIIWIAILLLADQAGLASNEVVPYMVNTHLYTGLKGLLGIGIIALAMSTADSTINSTAVIIANDVLPPLKLQKEGSLKAAKNATLFLGIFAVLLALRIPGLLDLILFSACFYAPIVVVPMLLAVFGFQTSRRVVLLGMGVGAAAVSFLLFVLHWDEVICIPPSLLANLIVVLGAHHLLQEKGGWGHNALRNKEEERLFRLLQPPWQDQITPNPKFKLRDYLERTLPTEDYFYSLFGFYVFTATYASFYLIPHEIIPQFGTLYRAMQYSVMLMFTTFLAFPIWPSMMQAKRLLTWLWPLCAFYALFLVGGTLVVLSGFAKSQILIFMLNFVMAVLLLHWPIAIVMAVSGIVLVIVGFSQHTDLSSTLRNLDTLQFRLSYGLLLFSSFLIALFKHKQAYDLLAQRNRILSKDRKVTQQELVKTLGHEARFFSEITTAGSNVLEAVKKQVDDFAQQAQALEKTQQLTTTQHSLEGAYQVLKGAIAYFQNVIYRVQGYLKLEVSYIMIDKLLAGALAVFQAQYTQQQPRPRITNTTTLKALECDPPKIQQLLVNAWLYAKKHNDPQKPIFLGIQTTALGYPIASIKDYIKEVPALYITVSNQSVLPVPKKLYMGAMGNTSFQVPRSMEELPILDNQRIVDAHYGTVEWIQESEDIITQAYVLPVYLREVRPSMMDLPQMEVGSVEERVSHEVLPEETALLKRLQDETPIDMSLAQKAIIYIKKYHGYMKRKSGEPFYLHPIAAADIILSYTEDQAAILASLLHDIVEDTPLTLSEIGVVFGPEVAAIVNKVTHLDGQFRRISMDAHENVRQLLEETDVRVLQVKLADRLHNMRTIQGHPSLEKQKKIAEETLGLFVPIARYLGLKQIKEELQELAAAVMQKV